MEPRGINRSLYVFRQSLIRRRYPKLLGYQGARFNRRDGDAYCGGQRTVSPYDLSSVGQSVDRSALSGKLGSLSLNESIHPAAFITFRRGVRWVSSTAPATRRGGFDVPDEAE